MTEENSGPDLGQAQWCGGVKLIHIPRVVIDTQSYSDERH